MFFCKKKTFIRVSFVGNIYFFFVCAKCAERDWSMLNIEHWTMKICQMHRNEIELCWNKALTLKRECRAPDTSRVRSKMLYASSKDRFKRELDGIQVELQATDPSEMSMDIIKSRALWNSLTAASSRSASAPALAIASVSVTIIRFRVIVFLDAKVLPSVLQRLYAIFLFYHDCRSPATAVN